MTTKKAKLTERVFQWSFTSDEKCLLCGEEGCQTRFKSSKQVILVRDCQPETYLKLPKYLERKLHE